MMTATIRRGEVWLVDLGDPNQVQGDEMYKRRPCVVVSPDFIGKLRLRVVVPLTTWKDTYGKVPWIVRLDPSPPKGLDRVTAADTFQIRSISRERFVSIRGALSAGDMKEIVAGILLVVGAS